MKRVFLQPAYVLHRRAYRETSFLVELLTLEYGRITVIAKGIRKTRGNGQALLQPFIPLLVSWSGRSDLMILSHVEAHGETRSLQGDCLFAGFYLNELIMYLLQKWDPHLKLYSLYETTLLALQSGQLEQKYLRIFEKRLLEELGYGPLPKFDHEQTFSADKFYRFVPEQGFVINETHAKNPTVFSGKSLIALSKENWQDEESLQDAKRLMRVVLSTLLGSHVLLSRKLFIQ